jgi:glycosyltransferase involved in cell wall biosynthesis
MVSLWATATEEERQELAYLGEQARLFPRAFPNFWYYSPSLYQALRREINKVHLLHLHQIWDYPIYTAARLAQRYGKPYVVSPHGIFNARWRYSTLKKRLYLQFIARPFLDKAACIHALTSAELQAFKEVGIQAPYTVVPNGVNPGEFSNLPSPKKANERWPALRDHRVVLFLGRLSPEKGLDQLVLAWRRVIREHPEAVLMIAGPNYRNYRASIERLVEREGLCNYILIPGMLQGEEKLMALSRADIFVLPSYSEGLSLAMLEALACGKPCVITTGCNIPDVATFGAGEVVEPRADALSVALLKLLSLPPQVLGEMGDRGRLLVLERYTWDIIARKMLTIYRCIMDNKPIPLHPEPST